MGEVVGVNNPQHVQHYTCSSSFIIHHSSFIMFSQGLYIIHWLLHKCAALPLAVVTKASGRTHLEQCIATRSSNGNVHVVVQGLRMFA